MAAEIVLEYTEENETRKEASMSAQLPDPAAPTPRRIVHQFYVPFQLPDPASPAGKSVARRLHDEPFIWLTTVDEEGVPNHLPSPFSGMKLTARSSPTVSPSLNADAWHTCARTPKWPFILKGVGETILFSREKRG